MGQTDNYALEVLQVAAPLMEAAQVEDAREIAAEERAAAAEAEVVALRTLVAELMGNLESATEALRTTHRRAEGMLERLSERV